MSDSAATRAASAVPAVIARLVLLASLLAALFLVVYVLLVVFQASQTNDIYKFFKDVARPIAWIFKGLFSPKNRRFALAVNYVVAAVVYLVAGQIVSRLIRRFA